MRVIVVVRANKPAICGRSDVAFVAAPLAGSGLH
jgi:hypothetical protein